MTTTNRDGSAGARLSAPQPSCPAVAGRPPGRTPHPKRPPQPASARRVHPPSVRLFDPYTAATHPQQEQRPLEPHPERRTMRGHVHRRPPHQDLRCHHPRRRALRGGGGRLGGRLHPVAGLAARLRSRRGGPHRHGAAPPRAGLRGVRQRPAGRGRRIGRRHRADHGPAARRRGPGLLLGGGAAHRGQGDQGRRGERQGRHPRAGGLPHRLPPAGRPSRGDARRHGGHVRLGARALAALAHPAGAERRAAARERRRGDRRRPALRRRHGQRDRGRAGRQGPREGQRLLRGGRRVAREVEVEA